jgi:hypothetical protein
MNELRIAATELLPLDADRRQDALVHLGAEHEAVASLATAPFSKVMRASGYETCAPIR